MRNRIQLIRPNGQVINLSGGGNRRRPTSAKHACPEWLLKKYKKFRPLYSYENGLLPVDLEKVRNWPDTREWVAVYQSNTYCTHDYDIRNVERYVWVWRDGRMCEIKQFGVPNFWRSSVEGWRG